MILHVTEAPKRWDSSDAQNLRNFLGSDSGRLLLDWLVFQGPSLLDGADVNKTLVMSGVVDGYSRALTHIVSLTKEQPEEVKTSTSMNYPSLDDDKAWTNEPTKSSAE